MQGTDILQTIAEISVAFAGFTGVVVAFGRRPQHGTSAINVHAFKAMLASSLQALLFSVLPFLLHASGLTEPRLWRVGSAIMLVGIATGAVIDVRYVRRADRTEWTRPDHVLQVVIPALGMAVIVAQVLNLAGVLDRSFAPYLGGLVFLLFFSAVMFVRLLTAPESGNAA